MIRQWAEALRQYPPAEHGMMAVAMLWLAALLATVAAVTP